MATSLGDKSSVTGRPFCSKCLGLYQDPLLLPCLHTFCRKCIKGLVKTVSSNVMVYCPTCNDTTPIPPDGADTFPPDVHLQHAATIARYTHMLRNQPPQPCDECSRDPALPTISFCCTCTSFLCQKCHTQHLLSRKTAINHNVLLLDDTSDVEVQLKENLVTFRNCKNCPQHVNEEIKLHCSECNELLCIQCALIKHPGHIMEDFNVYIKREKDAITDAVRDMPGAIEKLGELINTGKIVCNSIKSQKKIIDNEITALFVEVYKSLEEKKSRLLQKCSDIVNTKITAQTIQIDELSSLKSAIEVGTRFANRSKVDYIESEFLLVVDTVQARLRSLKKKIEQTSLQLCENDVINFNADSSNIVSCLSTFEVTSRMHRDYTTLYHPILKVKINNAYHVAVHKNGDMIMANHIGNSVEIYDNTGTRKSSLCSQQGQFSRPLGVAVMGDVLYVVEYSGNRCQKRTLNGEYLGDVGLSLLKYPWGCAVSKSGVLYVADTGNHRVQVFNPDGSVQGVLCSKPLVGTPMGVFVDQQENIHVTTLIPACVKVFSSNRNVIREYGKGILSQPSGVAVDQFGYCLIGDGSGNAVHFFDPSGNHMHKISFDGIIYGVAIDGKDNVYVVDNSNKVLYKY